MNHWSGSAALTILHGLGSHYGKTFVFPTQEKLCELVEARCGRRPSRRTINYWLKDLEQDGFIRRTRRHTRGKDGSLELRSTLYELTKKALRLFFSGLSAVQRGAQNLFSKRDNRSGHGFTTCPRTLNETTKYIESLQQPVKPPSPGRLEALKAACR